MNASERIQGRVPILHGEAIGQSRPHRKAWKDDVMSLKTTLIVGGLAAVLGTSAAFAQSYSGSPPPSQAAPYGHHRGHHHGVLALIREEVNAGRISQTEGTLLEQKIMEMKRERHAERQARNQGMQGNPQASQPQ
jgi:hypothetical protein